MKTINEKEFQNMVNELWQRELLKIFAKANKEIERYYDNKGKGFRYLKTPNFEVHSKNKSAWGTWNQSTRTLSVSSDLIRNFPYEAVVHVVRHEMAHMIVGEMWKLSGRVSPHGETFASACAILNIEANDSESATYLMAFKKGNDKIVDKVKKLMALSQSSNKNESESALRKAHTLMTKHNLSNVSDTDDVFTFRPIGIRFPSKSPYYLYKICHILEEYYHVHYIRSYHYVDNKEYRHYEIFGKPENLDLAEYVFHFLYNQGIVLWEEYKKEMKQEGFIVRGKTLVSPDPWGTNYTKDAFLEGLYSGYSHKLSEERDDNETSFESNVDFADANELLHIAESKRDKAYQKRYPNRTSSKTYGSRSGGWGAGRAKGEALQFRAGVGSNGNRGKHITG